MVGNYLSTMKGILLFVSLMVMGISACVDQTEAEEPTSFLRDLRPSYFNHLNFYDADTLKNLPIYLEDFTITYDLLEQSYKEGAYKIQEDLDNMALANLYYGSLLTALTKAYLDGILPFDAIIGAREKGLFSGKPISDDNLERTEMIAMAWRGVEVAKLGLEIIQANDRNVESYVSARHVYARLIDPYQNNNLTEQRRVVDYAQQEVDFEFISIWNLLKGMLLMDNYEDQLNTFDNRELEPFLENAIERINPETLPSLNNTYTGLFTAIYLMDITMKKVDWMIQREEELSRDDLRMIRGYLANMLVAELVTVNERADLLDSWEHKSSFEERQEKLNEIRAFIKDYNKEERPPKPQLAPFFQTTNFRQVYQCYTCHNTPNL